MKVGGCCAKKRCTMHAPSQQGDPDAKSSSVSEMLRKVPFVTVDSEGNNSVNGSRN